MVLINWIVQRYMKRVAKSIAKWVAESYPIIKSQNPNTPEPDVLVKLFSDDISKGSERVQKKINECCQSIEGLCYLVAMDCGPLDGFMNFRCLQFTRYMDRELHSKGFKKQSRETKERVLTALELNINGWQKITGDTM